MQVFKLPVHSGNCDMMGLTLGEVQRSFSLDKVLWVVILSSERYKNLCQIIKSQSEACKC